MARIPSRTRRLLDTYAFPGFRPHSAVKGVFGDPKSRIVNLHRRAKKRSAAAVAGRRLAGTTARRGAYAICRVVIRGCSWSSMCVVSSAGAAAK